MASLGHPRELVWLNANLAADSVSREATVYG